MQRIATSRNLALYGDLEGCTADQIEARVKARKELARPKSPELRERIMGSRRNNRSRLVLEEDSDQTVTRIKFHRLEFGHYRLQDLELMIGKII